MAEVELSKEQQAVVDARDCSLLVAAAAGSGKTFVLVKRIMDRILDAKAPLDIDRLLIVTFTNAAAAEMRERIGNAIEKAIEKDPENIQLKKQAALLSSAQISTIDSFCMSVVKENYHALDIDPGFTIEDESVLALLRDDVLTELLDEEYAAATPEFMRLMASYTGHKDDEGVRSMIYKIRHYADSDPRPEDWLDRAEEALDAVVALHDRAGRKVSNRVEGTLGAVKLATMVQGMAHTLIVHRLGDADRWRERAVIVAEVVVELQPAQRVGHGLMVAGVVNDEHVVVDQTRVASRLHGGGGSLAVGPRRGHVVVAAQQQLIDIVLEGRDGLGVGGHLLCHLHGITDLRSGSGSGFSGRCDGRRILDHLLCRSCGISRRFRSGIPVEPDLPSGVCYQLSVLNLSRGVLVSFHRGEEDRVEISELIVLVYNGTRSPFGAGCGRVPEGFSYCLCHIH